MRFKHLKAYRSSIWGEQHAERQTSDPLDHSINAIEELAAKIAELEHKDRVINK